MEPAAQVGRWRIGREVARGGMGAVYRARDPEGREAALKLLLAGQDASPLQRRRVATEVQALLRLRHPHVVALLDAGEHERVPWLAMEWVEGETLAAKLEREGALEPRAAVELVRALAGALEHCHAQGVLHRDVKPGNVLLRAGDGAPLLTDFGLSKDVAGEDLRSSASRSVRGRWLGTPGFWPPEQARGDLAAIGPRSDVYGLGALLYACLTGVPPQEGGTLTELVESLERPPVPPGRRRPGLPPWLDAVCLRALDADPARRQAGPGELARELEDGLLGRLRAAPTRGAAVGPARAATVAAALLVLGGAGVSAIAVLGGGASPVPRPPAEPVAQGEPPEPSGQEGAAPPRDARAYCDRGNARAQRGDPAGARADLDRALELDPDLADAHALRGALRHDQGDLAGALPDLDRALELAPDHASARRVRGFVHLSRGDLAGARADLDRAIELEPRVAVTHSGRGNVRLRQGDSAGAMADFDRAIELGSRNALDYLERAKLRAARGLPGTLEDLERALELDPRCAFAYYSRANVRQQQGDLDGALADFERTLELDPRIPEAWSGRGGVRAQRGDLRGARADYDRALELDPRGTMAWLGRAALRMQGGDLRGALGDIERFLELHPGHAQAPAARDEAGRLRARLAAQGG